MSTVLSLRISEEMKHDLDELSKETHRKKSEIIASWIEEKMELERWQIKKIKQSIMEADAGNFASEKDVQEFFKKWSS